MFYEGLKANLVKGRDHGHGGGWGEVCTSGRMGPLNVQKPVGL